MENEILKILKNMQSDIKEIKDDVKELKVQVKENAQILKALEHSSEVNKAEHDKIINNLAHVQGDIEGLRIDLTTMEIVTSKNWNDIARLKAIR